MSTLEIKDLHVTVETEARRLVVHGFFNELVRRIGVPEIAERLTETVEAELAKNVLRELD